MLTTIYWVARGDCVISRSKRGEITEIRKFADKHASHRGWYATSPWDIDETKYGTNYYRSFIEGYIQIKVERSHRMLFKIYDHHEAQYISPVETTSELMKRKREDYTDTQQQFYEIHNCDLKEDILRLGDFFDMLEANTPFERWDMITEAYQRYQRLYQEEA